METQSEFDIITAEKDQAASIGRNIKSIRQRTSLSQESFAELVGVSRQTVVNWEKGASMPAADKVCKIVKECDSSIEEIFGDIGAKKVEKSEETEEVNECLACADEEIQLSTKKKVAITVGKVFLVTVLSLILLFVLSIVFIVIKDFVWLADSADFAISIAVSLNLTDKVILIVLACLIAVALVLACIFKIINFRRRKR